MERRLSKSGTFIQHFLEIDFDVSATILLGKDQSPFNKVLRWNLFMKQTPSCYYQSYELNYQVTFSSLYRWKILTMEKIKTGLVLWCSKVQISNNRQLWFTVVYCLQIWTFLHHNTQPVLIFNKKISRILNPKISREGNLIS